MRPSQYRYVIARNALILTVLGVLALAAGVFCFLLKAYWLALVLGGVSPVLFKLAERQTNKLRPLAFARFPTARTLPPRPKGVTRPGFTLHRVGRNCVGISQSGYEYQVFDLPELARLLKLPIGDYRREALKRAAELLLAEAPRTPTRQRGRVK